MSIATFFKKAVPANAGYEYREADHVFIVDGDRSMLRDSRWNEREY